MRHDRRQPKFALVVAALGLPLLVAGSAIAQSSDDDLRSIGNRLDRIEREISDIQRQAYSGDGGSGAPTALGSGANTADLQSRLVQLEDQVRDLTGRLEEANHRAEQASRELQTFKADVELRFQDLQGGAAPASASGDSVAPAPADQASAGPDAAPAQSVLPSGTPQTQYDFAIDLMKRGQYPQARNAFLEFLQLHPKHELAGNAQYWLGETYYVQGDYKQAASAFLSGYRDFPKSRKAADSLLKLGLSLNRLGQKEQACAAYMQVGSQFPKAAEAKKRAQSEIKRAGC